MTPPRLLVSSNARVTGALVLAGTLVVGPVGCVANSSNPTVVIGGARTAEREATLDLDISNPGGRNLVVTRVEYQLAHGEMSFPVAEGAWSGELELPAGGSARLPLRVPFTVEPMEPDSRRLHLNGMLRLEDRTGFLGLKFMDLTATPFQAEIEATPPAADTRTTPQGAQR
ncbi:MAG: hypothetical protein RL354_2118 [Planctomycetota bacterium]|jgi:hypothetical protein